MRTNLALTPAVFDDLPLLTGSDSSKLETPEAHLRGKNNYAAASEAWSIRTPGPIVLETAIFFRY